MLLGQLRLEDVTSGYCEGMTNARARVCVAVLHIPGWAGNF